MAELPADTLRAGGKLALVTMGPTPYDREAAVKLSGRRRAGDAGRPRRARRGVGSIGAARARHGAASSRADRAAPAVTARRRPRTSRRRGEPRRSRRSGLTRGVDRPRADRRLQAGERRADGLDLRVVEPSLTRRRGRGADGRGVPRELLEARGEVAAARASPRARPPRPTAQPQAASAASRSRPRSRSPRARSVSSSQASVASRPDISAASRSAGRCLERRERFGGSGSASSRASVPFALGELGPGARARAERSSARGGVGGGGIGGRDAVGGEEVPERGLGALGPRLARRAASITVTRVTGTVPRGSRRPTRRGASARVTTTTSRTSSPAYRRTT